MNYPLISILIPTYNSAKTLKMTIKSLKKQSYPKNKLEILIVDGGSTDETLSIAKKNKCRVIYNPKTDIAEAEYLGFFKAKGKYLVGLAPDEVLKNPNSLKLKYSVFSQNKNVKAILPTGYKTPKNYSRINHYINEFGDPFSFFMYKGSKGDKYLIKDLERKYTKVREEPGYVVFDFTKEHELPLIELWAGGCMLDLAYAKDKFPEITKDLTLIPLIFYLFNKKGMLLGVTKHDPTVHYSTVSVKKYLKKIRSRVEFNIFSTTMGKGGYQGREKFSKSHNYKKYLFILYSFSLIFPLIDSFILVFSRKITIFFLHLPLCVYTSFLILYYHFIKTFKLKHTIKLYGH